MCDIAWGTQALQCVGHPAEPVIAKPPSMLHAVPMIHVQNSLVAAAYQKTLVTNLSFLGNAVVQHFEFGVCMYV